MGINIEDIMNKGNLTEKGSIFGQVEQPIKGSFIKDFDKEMEYGLEKEAISMKDLILLTVKTGLDSLDGQMETSIVDNFVKI